MQFRDHPGVIGKRDSYPVDPRVLKIDPSYNVRDLTTPDALAELHELKDSIIANGVRIPLEVRLDGEDLYVVAGHRRHAAAMLAIAEGHEIVSVPTIPEPKGTNDIERTLNLVISNSGKPLTVLETAEVVRRLLAFGWDVPKIASRLGKSPAMVETYTSLLGADSDVQAMVKAGTVSASTAAKVVKQEGSKASATLKAAAGASKNGKATAKSLAKSKGEVEWTAGNINRVVAALQYVANWGDKKCKDRAIKTLEAVGVDIVELAGA